MHTLLAWATDEQKEKYLRPLTEGRGRSCFAMTEPEVSGSDPTQIQTSAVKDGDDWVLNGHKWFISGARGAQFAICIARTDPEADPPQARNSAFLVDIPSPQACGFVLPRTVCKREITRDEAEVYVRNRRTDLLTDFTSRFGRPFSATLVLQDSGRHGFEFQPRKAGGRKKATTKKAASKKTTKKKSTKKKAGKKKASKKKTPRKKAATSRKAAAR